MKHLAASNILESLLVLIHSGGEGGLVRKGGVWGWKGVFANPFAACYVKPTAKTMGGNGRRVGWYKANRASQERIRSLHPFFLSLPPLSIFHLLFSLHTAGLPFPSYFGYCILMLAYSRVTLCSSLASVKILFASTSTFSPSRLSFVSFSLSFTLSAVWNFAVSSSLSEPRSRYRTFVTLEWNSLFHAFHSTLIFLVVYIYMYVRLVVSFFFRISFGYYYFVFL